MKKLISVFLSLLLGSAMMLLPQAYAIPENADLAEAAADESLVLLKNEREALPLTAADKIALFGEGQAATDGKTGGFYLMNRGSGYFKPSEALASPCNLLADAAADGRLGGVYRPLADAYKAAAEAGKGTDFTYTPSDAEYTAAAAYADKAVVILSRSSGEGRDLADALFALSEKETTLLQKVCTAFAGKPVIVVLNSGNTISCGFANGRVDGVYADAVLLAPCGGIRGAQALCNVLIGAVNPSGKTADTVAKALADYPSNDGFRDAQKTVYKEDIYVGYRYFETFDVPVDYEFGYGLSYTTFALSDYTYAEADGKITVGVTVKNTGSMAGKEVVQLYFAAPQRGTDGAVLSKAAKELCAFAKTDLLAPGKAQTLTLSFDVTDMASYDDLGATGHPAAYVLEAGDYAVYAGTSVRRVTRVGTHNEPVLRVTGQLSTLCEPTTAFARMTYDGKETVGENTSFASELLHKPTAAARTYPAAPIQFAEVLRGDVTMDDFLAQMSDDELCTITVMTHALGVPAGTHAFGASPAVAEKYGIPAADTADGPQGLRISTSGTGIPCGTALAQTWNAPLCEALGAAVGKEAVLSGVDVWLAPGVNLHRHPLCGRNFEYYSEDPYLSGVLASSIIRAVGESGVTCTVKHLVCNEREYKRTTSDSIVSERALRELYLKPFKMAVDAGVRAVMTSYNRLNGTETAEHTELLRGILRGEWGFDGIITTDWSNDSDLVRELLGGSTVKASNDPKTLGTDGLKAALRTGRVSRSLLLESAGYMMRGLAELPDGARLLSPTVTKVTATGETKFEAEDFTLKHNYARPEISASKTVMSYTRATAEFRPWLDYTLDVEAAGCYVLSVAEANSPAVAVGDALSVYVNGVEQVSYYNAVSTGSWSATALRRVATVELPAGQVTLRIKANPNRATGNYDYFTLRPLAEVATPIGTAAELLALMQDSTMWSGHYSLTADIDLMGVAGQAPIGTTATNFTGSFDGCGYTVRGLSLTTSSEKDFGLFGKTKDAVITRLTVEGQVTSTTAKDAVVGGIVGTADPGTVIVNCENRATVLYTGDGTNAAKGVGGVCGYVYAGGTLTGTAVKGCTNTGSVTSLSGTKESNVGGIVGCFRANTGSGNAVVYACTNTGDVRATGIRAGGIVGYAYQSGGRGMEILASRNCGTVSTDKGRTGGIVGMLYSTYTDKNYTPRVADCINEGAVHAGTGYETGGIVGFTAGGSLARCVNLGSVTANDEKPCGGVTGKTYSPTTASGIVYGIDNCYTTSLVPLPAEAHESADFYPVTDTETVTAAALLGGETALPLGADGYLVTPAGLLPAALCRGHARGDVNADGSIDVLDVLFALRGCLDGDAPYTLADCNEDGTLTLADILLLLRYCGK